MSSRARIAILALAAHVGCGGGESTPPPDAFEVIVDVDAAPNLAPIADAGTDRLAGPGTVVSLDGRGSYDPELAPLTYFWLVGSAPATSTATLDDPERATPEIELTVPGRYVFVLVVDDGELASDPDAVEITVTDGVPVADAGPDREVPHGGLVALDGAASFDVDGGALWYSWTLTARPPGSGAALDDPTTVSPTFTADLVGTYELDLRVYDGMTSSAPDHLVITATNTAPVVSAGADGLVTLGDTVVLAGAATDLEGDPVTVTWTLTEKPAASAAAPTPETALTTTIAIDHPGVYRLRLTVSDGLAVSHDDVVVGTANGAITLTHDVHDAEYSRGLDRLVMISDVTDTVSIFDPETGAEISVPLSATPDAISIAPNGAEAVVGHVGGSVSVVDLVAAEVTATWPTTAAMDDIIHGGNGYAYVIPASGDEIRCLALATGVETDCGMVQGSRGRRNPTQDAIYLTNHGVSPASILKYSIAAGIATFVTSVPSNGPDQFCGDLWFTDDGARIVTACGNVFRASTDPGIDLDYHGMLSDTDRVRHADHSTTAHVAAVIPGPAGTHVDLYEDTFLTRYDSVALTAYVLGEWETARGQFVFFDQAGTALYVVMTATSSAGPRTVVWRAL